MNTKNEILGCVIGGSFIFLFVFVYYQLILVQFNLVNPKHVNNAIFKSSYTNEVRKARRNLLARCDSLKNINKIKQHVGIEPGSIDIVITTVNFTIITNDEKSKFYVDYRIDDDKYRNACEPRATVSTSMKWSTRNNNNSNKKTSFRCDHYASSKSCCVKWSSPSTMKKDNNNNNRPWGQCQKPTESNNNNCRCKNCYDYRLRRTSMLFNEVRQQLRSFENNGLFIQSKKHPNGIIRKVFIVYNEGTGNNAPTWLMNQKQQNNFFHDHNVITIPHKVLWKAYGNMTGYPSANRNAISSQLHRIPGLAEWFIYLEDDIFLNAPLTFKDNEKYITNDGRIVSYLNDRGIMDKMQSKNGWRGAIFSTIQALQNKFGIRHIKSNSLIKGMENIVIGKRGGESEHGPRLFNKCVFEEIWRLWPNEYAATVSRKSHTPKDFQIITHHGMFLEDLGLGKNIPTAGMICHEIHTLSSTNINFFINSICKTWKMKKIDWLQVQGDGISDEYMSENRMAMGNLRWAWQCLTEAMWPKQSIYEFIPFGDGGEYNATYMKKEGMKLCM